LPTELIIFKFIRKLVLQQRLQQVRVVQNKLSTFHVHVHVQVAARVLVVIHRHIVVPLDRLVTKLTEAAAVQLVQLLKHYAPVAVLISLDFE
jgi:hypothetical protein